MNLSKVKDTKPRLVVDKSPASKVGGVPLIVNTRWNVTSLRAETEDSMRMFGSGILDLSDGPTREMFRERLLSFAEHVAHRISGDFERAAVKGIIQALNLIQNPDYYETVKERRRRQARSYKADQEEREIEARRRRFNPTPEERERDIKNYRDWIERDEKRLTERKARLVEIESGIGTPIDELVM